MYNVIIENEMMKMMIRDENKLNLNFLSKIDSAISDFSLMTDHVQLDIASLISKIYRDFQIRVYDVKNKRYMHHKINFAK